MVRRHGRSRRQQGIQPDIIQRSAALGTWGATSTRLYGWYQRKLIVIWYVQRRAAKPAVGRRLRPVFEGDQPVRAQLREQIEERFVGALEHGEAQFPALRHVGHD